MKKVLTVLLVCILSVAVLSLCSCTDGKGGTFYPTWDKMQANLEKGEYVVTVTDDLGDKCCVTHLSATKGNEYIEFYWLYDAVDCDYFCKLLEEKYTDYNSLVKIENDEKFGNIVYCGTENAVNAAGIKVVKVKV